MGFKISSAIAIARGILNDVEEEYRYSNDDLVEYGNGCLRSLAELKPEWLTEKISHACVAGASQALDPAVSHRLISVVGSVQCDRQSLDAFMPDWRSATSGILKNWFALDGFPRAFEVYPPSPAGQIITVEHVRVPGPYALDDDTGLPDTISDAVAEYIVAIAELRDDEHVLSNRSNQVMQQFAARLGIKTSKQPAQAQ